MELLKMKSLSNPRIAHIIPTLDRYVEHRIPTGGFMEAVLSNDLKEACARADSQNRYLLFEIIEYCYNNIPSICWGSREKVAAWLGGNTEI